MKIYRNLRIVLRGMRLAKKIAATCAGFALSVILFLGTKSLVLDCIMGGDGSYQHEVFKIICFVIMPFAIFLGSCLTGALIARMVRRLLLESIIFSPGLWGVVGIMVFTSNVYPHLIGEMVIISGILFAVSFAGMFIGIAIRRG